MNPLAHLIRTVLGLTFIAVGIACGIVTFYLFNGVHFIVSDAVGDQREMQDFASDTSWWQDQLEYFPFYLPVLITGFLAALFCCGGIATLFRSISKNHHTKNKGNISTKQEANKTAQLILCLFSVVSPF